jgi:RimJ/RimL family protein N-acetyltransferase
LNVHFYRYDPQSTDACPPRLDANLHIRCWQPELDGFPPRGSRRLSNIFWWLLSRVGAFARGGFTEICIEQDGRPVHRLIVTPAWFRFPFMSARDLQIGDVWTAPDARRQQLARAAIAEAHRRFADENACFWYVTDADNAASAALAQSCGYRLVATGRRTRPSGLPLLGRYVIEQLV